MIMKQIHKILFTIVAVASILLLGCREGYEHPNAPNVYINFTIEPNSTKYQPLNIVSGYMYLTSEAPSRGIIVYRMTETEFKAYDRIPPNEPNACHDGNGGYTRLIVDFPFVVDNCNNIKYNILNGMPMDEGGIYPLVEYHTAYDGRSLRIYN